MSKLFLSNRIPHDYNRQTWSRILQDIENNVNPYRDSGRNLVASNISGDGIKLGPETPAFGWHDLLGKIGIRGIGASDPSYNDYRGNIRGFQFDANEEVFIEYHIPHDYVPGSDIYIHTHWSFNGTTTAGSAAGTIDGGAITWGFECTYAKGHNQDAFIAPVTRTVASTFSTDFPATTYQHILTETQLSAASPAASQLDSDDLEPDGIILCRAYLSATTITVASGLVPDPFLHFVDVHYQSTGVPTKQKSPDFYASTAPVTDITINPFVGKITFTGKAPTVT